MPDPHVQPIGPVRISRLDAAGQPTGESTHLRITELRLAPPSPWRRLRAWFLSCWPGQRVQCARPPGIPEHVELHLDLTPLPWLADPKENPDA